VLHRGGNAHRRHHRAGTGLCREPLTSPVVGRKRASICAEPHCDRLASSHGRCGPHHAGWQAARARCTEPGCGNIATAAGWGRWRAVHARAPRSRGELKCDFAASLRCPGRLYPRWAVARLTARRTGRESASTRRAPASASRPASVSTRGRRSVRGAALPTRALVADRPCSGTSCRSNNKVVRLHQGRRQYIPCAPSVS
jgi:hypothetical protein